MLDQMLQGDADLRVMASSPLMLNIFITAYRGSATQDLVVEGSFEMKQKHLFATYVQWMFKRRSPKYASVAQMQRWLTFLASQMRLCQHSAFYPDLLDRSWLRSRYDSILRNGSVGFLFGLLGGLIFGVFEGLMAGLTFGLAIGLLTSFWTPGLAWSEEEKRRRREYEQEEKRHRREYEHRQVNWYGYAGGVIVGVIGLLTAGLFGHVSVWQVVALFCSPFVLGFVGYRQQNFFHRFSTSLGNGMLSGMIGMLIIKAIGVLAVGLSRTVIFSMLVPLSGCTLIFFVIGVIGVLKRDDIFIYPESWLITVLGIGLINTLLVVVLPKDVIVWMFIMLGGFAVFVAVLQAVSKELSTAYHICVPT